MKNIKDTVFIIQSRTTSTRVPNKMLRPFAGSSLFEIAVEKILSSKLIPKNNFLLSVMDDELIDIAKKHGINYFVRSEESTQEPITLSKVFEWHDKIPFKHYVHINGCSPLLSIETIEQFTSHFLKSKHRGLFGVFKKKTFLFGNEGDMLNKFYGDKKYLATLETKFVETCYEAAHSLYAGALEDISKDIYMGSFKKKNDPEFFVIEERECFDIDWPWQFEEAELKYKNYKL